MRKSAAKAETQVRSLVHPISFFSRTNYMAYNETPTKGM